MRCISPENERELADAIGHAAEHLRQVEIVASGTKRGLGRPVEAEIRIEIGKITGIVCYEPDELIFTARAGTLLAEAEAALAEKRQMFAFAPADWAALYRAVPGRATLGGIVSANACGSRKIKAGAVRDHLIGCRFVNGSGEAIKAGGRVVKNVTGFDIPKIMCGAFGTLGALTELTFRVVPAPQRAPSVAIRNCTAEDGLSYLRQAARMPLEPTGLAYLPAAVCAASEALAHAGLADSNGLAVIRIEGAEDPIIDKLARLRSHFARQDCVILDDDATRALFREVENGTPFLGRDTDIWRLHLPAANAHAAILQNEAQLWYADWAGEGLWLGLSASRDMAERLRRVAAEHSGYATLMRADENARARLPVFEPEPPARAALSRAVKAAFDPLKILNSGRMYEEL